MREAQTSPRSRRKSVVALTALVLAMSALLAAAFASPAGAASTALCKVAENPCHSAYPSNTAVTLEAKAGTVLKIETDSPGGATFTCSNASATLETQAEVSEPLPVGEPLPAELQSFQLGACEGPAWVGGKECTAKTTILNSEAGFSSLGNSISFGHVSWQIECVLLYTGKHYKFTFDAYPVVQLKGGSPATLRFDHLPMYCEGLCTEAQLSAEFTVSPKPLYLEEAVYLPITTTLCKASETVCAEKNSYPSETAITAELKEPLLIHNNLTDVTCSGSSLQSKTSAAAGKPLPISISAWTFSGCTVKNGTCTLTVEKTAAGGSLLRSAGGNGVLTLGSETPEQFRVKCTSFGFIKIDCKYELKNTEATFEGGNPAHLAVSRSLPFVSGSALCPTETSLAASYTVTAPKPAYVTR